MKDYFLRAVSEAALRAALQSAGLYSPETGYIRASMTHGLDVVGVLVHQEAVYDVLTGKMLVPLVLCAGFHANLRLLSGDLPASLTSLVIATPKTPSVIWL